MRLPRGPCNSFSLCTSPAGPLVALACADHSVRLMRMELGRTLWTASALQLHSASDSETTGIEEQTQTPRVRDPVPESALSITCAGDLLAVGTHSGRVLVLDVHSGLRYSDVHRASLLRVFTSTSICKFSVSIDYSSSNRRACGRVRRALAVCSSVCSRASRSRPRLRRRRTRRRCCSVPVRTARSSRTGSRATCGRCAIGSAQSTSWAACWRSRSRTAQTCSSPPASTAPSAFISPKTSSSLTSSAESFVHSCNTLSLIVLTINCITVFDFKECLR